MIRSSFKAALLSMCAVSALATAAHAQNIVGGGSSLASVAYPQLFATYSEALTTGVTFNSSADGGKASNCSTTALTDCSYASVGSGAGQRAFLGNDALQLTSDFRYIGAGQGGANVTVDYGASDSTLGQSQINTWYGSGSNAPASCTFVANTVAKGGATTNGSRCTTDGALLEVPTFGTPITVPYNLSAQVAALGSNGAIRLTDADLCAIFSGQVTQWQNLPSSVAGTITRSGVTAPTGQINVAYRSDGSGTTFLLTQHLHAVCDATGTAGNSPTGFFTATQTFASLFTAAGYTTFPTAKPTGSSFTGANGSGGVQATVFSTANSVSYVSPDFTTIAANNAGLSGFPVVAAVFNNGAYILPTVSSTRLGLGSATIPANGNSFSIYTPNQYVPAVPAPSSGYPVVGFTTWDFAQCYAATTVANVLQDFLSDLYGSSTAFTNTVVLNGFSPLPASLDSLLKNTVLSASATGTGGQPLGISNPTACGSISGRSTTGG